ncbi:hypothetical protein O181_100435 [Austropuccinia psidii MF-1]|uniref:Uncharacterized protein n=1 Tax=Austropuccinia psidii MF-1 TaxID=1389203 RepID=A0A9Q3PGV8_9BASI|nr:hypothetical protein [Austropuccinia psidii MF-1]
MMKERGHKVDSNSTSESPPQTMFPNSPRGLPLDFYDIKWYKSKLPAQRQNIADWKSVTFLQNPKCLLEFTFTDEKIDEPDDDNDTTKEERNYGKSLELDIGEEEEKDEELEPVRRKEKGKAQILEDKEESSENDDMEIDNAASNGFYGGLTEEEWNAWQS